MAKVEFRYKDENKEERVLEYDTKTCMEAVNLWERYLKENNADNCKEIQICHMSVMDKNWKGGE